MRKQFLAFLILFLIFLFGCANNHKLPPGVIAVGDFRGECFKIELLKSKSESGNTQAIVIGIPCDDPLIKNNLPRQ